jgi:hypothetical protein
MHALHSKHCTSQLRQLVLCYEGRYPRHIVILLDYYNFSEILEWISDNNGP